MIAYSQSAGYAE
jgi:ATP-binding cassette subfamily B (MDR/TAP) protein 1